MKNQKFKNYFNFVLLFFSLFLMKCSNNDIIIEESSSKVNGQIQTLSKEEIAYFSSSHFNNPNKTNLYSKSSKQPFVLPILDSITQEKITNSNSYLTIIPTKKIKKNIDSRILLLKIDDSIQSIVLSMVSYKTKTDNLFSGRIYISNLNGDFINGYVANNGHITARLVKKAQEKKSNLTARTTLSSDVDECPYDDKRLCELDTITITASSGDSGSISITYIYSGYTYNDQNTSNNTNPNSWDYGGGSSGSNVNLSHCDYTINGCDNEFVEENKPDPESFCFKTKGLWQEAATTGVKFWINLVTISSKGIKTEYKHLVNFPQPILFGMPANLKIGNIDVSNEVAAEVTANAVNNVMKETSRKFAFQEVSTMTVEQYFRSELTRQFALHIPGGRVQFNAMNFSGVPCIFRHL